jgi:hypothetical protein
LALMPAPVALPPPVASAAPTLTVIADVAREKRRPMSPRPPRSRT